MAAKKKKTAVSQIHKLAAEEDEWAEMLAKGRKAKKKPTKSTEFSILLSVGKDVREIQGKLSGISQRLSALEEGQNNLDEFVLRLKDGLRNLQDF